MTGLGFTRGDVVDLAIEVWRGFLGMSVEPLDESIEVDVPSPLMTACISIKSVSWYGGIIVTYPLDLSRQATSYVLGMDDPGLDDVRDVIGEAANMMGGRLKYFLPPGSEVSLPILAVGSVDYLSIAGSRNIMSLSFLAEGAPFKIVLVRSDDEAAG